MSENLSSKTCDQTMILDSQLYPHHMDSVYNDEVAALGTTDTIAWEVVLAIAPNARSCLNGRHKFRAPTLTLGLV